MDRKFLDKVLYFALAFAGLLLADKMAFGVLTWNSFLGGATSAFAFAAVVEPSSGCSSEMLCGGDDVKRYLLTLLILSYVFGYAYLYIDTHHPYCSFELKLAIGISGVLCLILLLGSLWWHSYRLSVLFMVLSAIFDAAMDKPVRPSIDDKPALVLDSAGHLVYR